VLSTAEAVVVGGGVIGASVAFHLTRVGLRSVVLVDRGTLAGQASGRSGALVRTHYTNAPEARLALASLPWFEQWRERVGGDCGFRRTGFLQLVTAADRARLSRNVEMLRELGVETSLVAGREIVGLQPGLEVEEGALGAYEPRSGYADPTATTRSLAAAAERGGATVREGLAVEAIATSAGRVTGVRTAEGVIETPIVVLANGAWSDRLLRPLGVELPIRATRVQVAFFARPPALGRGPAGHLTMIDRANGFYARPHGDDLTLVGLSAFYEPIAELDAYSAANDPEFVPLARRQAGARIAGLGGALYVRGHAGPLDVTPDGGAILDRAPGVAGLYLALGLSGTGFKKAPAIGACLAELITVGAATTAPLEPFRVGRFGDGDLIENEAYSLPAAALSQADGAARRRAGLVH
jgi:sarcosine oxidase subunit beta